MILLYETQNSLWKTCCKWQSLSDFAFTGTALSTSLTICNAIPQQILWKTLYLHNKNLVPAIVLLTQRCVIILTLKPSFCSTRANLRAPSFASSSLNNRREQEWAAAWQQFIYCMVWHAGVKTHKQQLAGSGNQQSKSSLCWLIC